MGREITLYDTRTRRPQRLEPRDPGRVGIYACGPTVYSRVHVGNARPYVTFLLLKRFLEHEGYEVSLVVNVTDVNDKIYTAAATADVASDALAREMTAAYVADTDRLGLGRPDHEPLASETIGPIVALIADLVEREHAYEAGGDVYFRVRSLPAYGELSRRDLAEMDQGEGVEGAERKEDPLDFALWKAEKAGEDTAWESPWGRGRPGWHIECSAMAEQLLGLRVRHPRRRGRPRLPPPRERGGPDAGGPRRPAGPAVDAQRDGAAGGGRPRGPACPLGNHRGRGQRRREDVEVAREHPRAGGGA